MRTDPRPDEVRQLVAKVLEDFGLIVAAWSDIEETILVDRGRSIARSYRTDGHLAMWLIEVGLVQFYDAEGNMLTTVNLFESFEPHRLAA